VKVYLESPETQDKLRSMTKATNFSPNVALLTSSILRLRKCLSPMAMDYVRRTCGIIQWCMSLAYREEAENSRSQVVLLDDLDRTASLIREQMTSGSAYKTFSSFILESSKVSQMGWHPDFLSLATVTG
jgi:hypothetical protein